MFEWLTGLAGVVLLVSLFLPWYGAEGFEGTANAWQALSVLDFVLAAVALLAIAHPIVAAVQRTAAVPQTLASFVVWFAIVAVVVALIRVVSLPDVAGVDASGNAIADTTREIGVWIGLLGAVGVFLASWNSMRDKRFPRAMRPNLKVETIATPTPDGERRDATR
jgi:hypothetical protein